MAKLSEILNILEGIAPLSTCEEWDNSGLLVYGGDDEIRGIAVCLDATEDVIAQAVRENCNLIVSHHPIIFSPIKCLTPDAPTYPAVCAAIKNNVSVYSMHTCLDSVSNGICDEMARLYGIADARALNGNKQGLGRVGDIAPITVKELARKTEKLFDFPAFVCGDDDKTVSRIAVFNGGSADEETILQAHFSGAQCVITNEVKHHIALYALSIGVALITSSHYATERFYIPALADRIEKELKNIKVAVCKETNPLHTVK
jgi:dinuclear metal center YbgI/SA1388 family protein